ncbi:unnamed protein product [Victoria cruziana]
MGKFMRKCKEMGEVGVPPAGGARTRARALAELRRRSGGVVSGELQVSYLELRSRRLVKNGLPKERTGEFGSRVAGQESPAVNSGAGDGDARVSMCSGTGSSEEEKVGATRGGGVSDPEVEASPGECSADYECIESVRETSPPTDLRGESELLESTTSSALDDSVNYRRKPSRVAARMTAPASEIEEFFAAFEKEEKRRFSEKYNYDVVKDIPLAGRYEWVKVTP